MRVLTNNYDRRYLNIAMPAAIESIFMILLASADLIMVGTLGAVSVAAVSIFLQPRLVLLCFSRSMASAVTLLASRKAGAGDVGEVSGLLRKSVFLCAIFMGILHLIFFCCLEQILLLMGASSDYLAEAMAYGTVATISVYITSLTLILQAVQLGFGETAVIMKTNILGNIVNVICNAFLIFGLGPLPELGVTGAAIGTVIGTLVTFAFTVYVMRFGKYFAGGGSILPDRGYFREFLPVFGSVFTEQGCERIGMVLFARMAAGLGTIPFAVHSICMNICDIYYDFALGLGKASMVLAGQSCGAKNETDWKRFKWVGIKWSMIFSTVSFVLTAVFREQIFGIYTNDPEAIAMSGMIMLLVAFVSYPEAHAIVCAGILRGSGQTAVVALYSFILITVLRPLMTAFFLYYLELGLTGAWLALILDQGIRSVCSSFLLQRIKKIA